MVCVVTSCCLSSLSLFLRFALPSLPHVFLGMTAVRLWVARVAGSLVLGAILGGAIAYFAFPRVLTIPDSPGTASGNSGAPSSWWYSTGGKEQRQGNGFESPGEIEQNFGDRLNKALLAARAGEAAAQQGLLVRTYTGRCPVRLWRTCRVTVRRLCQPGSYCYSSCAGSLVAVSSCCDCHSRESSAHMRRECATCVPGAGV